jgi:hypothetical protein
MQKIKLISLYFETAYHCNIKWKKRKKFEIKPTSINWFGYGGGIGKNLAIYLKVPDLIYQLKN